MTQDAQVRKLFSLLSAGHSLRLASLKTGMDEKTARKYRKANRMPSELSACHDWRTRPDPFATVWDRVQKQLSENPGLQVETAIEKGTTSAAEKGTSRQSKREPPDAKYSAGWLTEVVFLQSTRQEGSTGAFNGRFRTNSQAGSC